MRSVQPQLRCGRGRVARITEIKIFMKNTHKEYANPLNTENVVIIQHLRGKFIHIFRDKEEELRKEARTV